MYLNSKLVRSLIEDIISAGEKSKLFSKTDIKEVKLTTEINSKYDFYKNCFGLDFRGLCLEDFNDSFISICKNYIFPKYNGIFNIFDYRCGEDTMFLFKFGDRVSMCSGDRLSEYFVARQNLSGMLNEVFHGYICIIEDEGSYCSVTNHYYRDDILRYNYSSGAVKYSDGLTDMHNSEKNAITAYLKAYLKAISNFGAPIHEGFLYNPIPKYIDATPYFDLGSGECVLWSDLSGLASVYCNEWYMKPVYKIPINITGIHDVRSIFIK